MPRIKDPDRKLMCEAIGAWMRAERARRRLLHQDVSDALGLKSSSHLPGRYERGTHMPDVYTLWRISRVYGVSVVTMLDEIFREFEKLLGPEKLEEIPRYEGTIVYHAGNGKVE